MIRNSLQDPLQLFLPEIQHGICISLSIFLKHKKSILPASAGAATTKTATAESSESAATAKSAAAG